MSMIIGVGFSEKEDPFLAATEAAKTALYQIHHRPIALALLFSTIHFAHQRLLDGIHYALGNVKLLGCSGSSVIWPETISKYGVGLMLISMDRVTFGEAAGENIKIRGARQAGEDFARQALKNLGTPQRDLALIFCDGLVENGSDLLKGIKDALGLSFPIFGAAAADNFCFHKTYQYFEKRILTDSIVGLVFAGENIFGMGLRHGWKPLGRPHTITSVKGNVIKTIEDKPAVAIYEEYFGKSRQEIEKTLIEMSIYFPLGLYVPGESEYLLRNVLRIDEDGGLVCQGDAAAGSDVRLMMGTKEWALNAATQAAQEAKDSLKDREIKGALVFESISRHKLLGRLTEKELSRIKKVLGNVPILGICSYGEQAPLKSLEHYGETYFHNETLAILAIGEPHASDKHI
ncbi:MAG: FIST N-terminal domain-containing protein [Candidatus Omnitrophica bacterium]|nr:FIST N-terminal domain-containing protein [Candidatus Omnitrophota bacterium]